MKFLLALVAVLCLCSSSSADDAMFLADTTAAPGEGEVSVVLTFTNDDPMEGYSVALSYPTANLNCEEVVDLTDLDPEYFEFAIDDEEGTVVLGVILDLNPTELVQLDASATDEVEIAGFLFFVEESALPADITVELVDDLGSPAISNVYSRSGEDYSPSLGSAIITVENNNFFYFNNVTGAFADGSFSADLYVEHPFDLEGMSVEINWDPDVLTLDSQDFSATVDILGEILPDDDEIEFLLAEIEPDEGQACVSMIYDFPEIGEDPNGDKVLPADTDGHKVIEYTFTVDSLAELDDETDLTFGEDCDNLVVYFGGQNGVRPNTEDLTIIIGEEPPPLEFIRGDVNADGTPNLADAIFELKYIFLSGEDLRCFKAGDLNDDGGTDLADVIYMLKWMFNDGTDPVEPYPDCGVDESDDDLSCLSSDCP